MTNFPVTGPAGTGRLVEFGPDGSATIERSGQQRRLRLHRGCRFGHVGPHPQASELLVIAFESGPGPTMADDMLLTAVSPDGLEALARALLAAVERHRAGRAIDMRFLV